MTRLTKDEFVARMRGAIEYSSDYMPYQSPQVPQIYNKWRNEFSTDGLRIQYEWLPSNNTYTYIYILDVSVTNPPNADQVTFLEDNSYVDDFPEDKCEEALYRLPYITSKWLHVEVEAAYEFYDVHYESPLGTRVTQVNVNDEFYVVGVYREKATQEGVSGETVYAYQTDENGTPVTPYVYDQDTTDENGSFEIGGFTADEAGTVYFVVYDSAQNPS